MFEEIKTRLPEMLEKLKASGITEENILALYLFGSKYWGYSGPESDLDLYLILNEGIEAKNQETGDLSFRYISTKAETDKAIEDGSWARYYILKYASYQLLGESLDFPEYVKSKFPAYIKEKDFEKGLIEGAPLKWGFLTLMLRVFFVNYYYFGSTTFKLDDFKKCKLFDPSEIEYLEEMHRRLQDREDASSEEKLKFLPLIEKVERYALERLE